MVTVLGLHLRMQPRPSPLLRLRLVVPSASILLAFLTGFVLITATGADAALAYSRIAAVFLSPSGIAQALAVTSPLLLISIGLAIAFRAGFWNIGAEGQYLVGAIAATGVVLFASGSLGSFSVPVMFLSAFGAGAAWGAVPAILKARLRVNEVLTSLMMVYIAVYLIIYLVFGPWRDPRGLGFPGTALFPATTRLPRLPGSTLDVGIILGLLIALVLYVVMRQSTLGFEIRVTGASPEAARYAGIGYLRTVLLSMMISGGLAGVAGMAIISGQLGYLRAEVASGYGFVGIIIAWLAGLNILGVIPAAFLFGGIEVSADVLQTSVGLPEAFAILFESVIFLYVITGEIFLRYRIQLQRRRVK